MRYLIWLLCVMANVATAADLEGCETYKSYGVGTDFLRVSTVRQQVILPSAPTAVSWSIPLGAVCLNISRSADVYECPDNAANEFCGTSRPLGTVSEGAWNRNSRTYYFSPASPNDFDHIMFVNAPASASGTEVILNWYVGN